MAVLPFVEGDNDEVLVFDLLVSHSDTFELISRDVFLIFYSFSISCDEDSFTHLLDIIGLEGFVDLDFVYFVDVMKGIFVSVD